MGPAPRTSSAAGGVRRRCGRRQSGLSSGEVDATEENEVVLDHPPSGDLLSVVDAGGVEALVRVHDQVFGGAHAAMGRGVLAGLTQQPRPVEAVVAMTGSTAVAAGRVNFHAGTDFASLWGGGTIPTWRGRGVFRSLVSHRAAAARERGFRYLQVDAWKASKPILQRLGFIELATTTPYKFPV